MIENTQAESDEMDEFERLFGDNAEADAVEKAWAELENGTFQPKPKPPEWHVIESPYHPGLTIPAKTYDAIMFGITPCTFCNGTGEITVVEQWGDTDIRRTVSRPCRVETKMREKKAYIKRLLPSRYQRSNILSLEPSPNSKMSLERQARVIRFLKDNQHRGYFFFGGPGTGKTTYATSLVRGCPRAELGQTHCDKVQLQHLHHILLDSLSQLGHLHSIAVGLAKSPGYGGGTCFIPESHSTEQIA